MDLLRTNLKLLFAAAVKSVQPQTLIPSTLQRKGNTLLIHGKSYPLNHNCYVAAFGKAAAGMAAAVELIVGDHLVGGIVSVPRGIQTRANTLTDSKLEFIEGAAGNLPDSDAVKAADKILAMTKKLDESALLVVLISGGGSALLPLPRDGVTLGEKLDVIRLLVEKAASIVELNCVRKKLSVVKGGGLALASHPAKTLTLILSDVIGDPIESIASGPTSPNADLMTASSVIQKYGLENAIPSKILEALSKEAINSANVPVCGDSFCHVDNILVGNNQVALRAVHSEAQKLGYIPVVMFSDIQGIARTIGSTLAHTAQFLCKSFSTDLDVKQYSQLCVKLAAECQTQIDKDGQELFDAVEVCKKSKQGLCLIFGGETTVQVTGKGVGGRNQELALSFAISIEESLAETDREQYHVALLSAGTDGIDGPTPAAGALAYYQQIAAARAHFMTPSSFLEDNDSHSFYAKLHEGEDLVMSGHTGTNVMDVIILIIQPF